MSHWLSDIFRKFVDSKNGNLVYVNTSRMMNDGHREMRNSMEICLGVVLIFLGLAIMVWTYRRASKVENKFSVTYFMIISGYGAGIGSIAIGANILCTL